ncbi:hypothetical protein AVEN_174330-1 [Araneus ventricosus]|uniref:Uncharacterized protein n=1 Tax=Araneus ventricosus TaxID=182803 RepID=A0A4Y2KME3_ARAVE|nr:hypothetical protein AVEN_248350-1 [Araneus ventricosus]GBN02688.1 hypothetical protein AVEN_271810-1 [Araneus ventricosus]GBN02749.1 hypothetical protein AVEN_140437-1 [Araneus ventricosus]GBN02767.1 hypothetical protein AVEN_174330-1 [Araneus ventricosus]
MVSRLNYATKVFTPHGKNFQNEIVRNNYMPFDSRNGEDIETEIQKFTTDHKTALDNTGKWNYKTGENFSDEIRDQTQIRNRLNKVSQLTKDPRDENLYNRAHSHLRKLHQHANDRRKAEKIASLNPDDGSVWKQARWCTGDKLHMPPSLQAQK